MPGEKQPNIGGIQRRLKEGGRRKLRHVVRNQRPQPIQRKACAQQAQKIPPAQGMRQPLQKRQHRHKAKVEVQIPERIGNLLRPNQGPKRAYIGKARPQAPVHPRVIGIIAVGKNQQHQKHAQGAAAGRTPAVLLGQQACAGDHYKQRHRGFA